MLSTIALMKMVTYRKVPATSVSSTFSRYSEMGIVVTVCLLFNDPTFTGNVGFVRDI